jgi:hypothetical protein
MQQNLEPNRSVHSRALRARMDAVEAWQSPSSLCRADREALERILPAVAGALGSEYFLAIEAVASENAAIVLVLAGMNARRLGKLLRRGDGVPVAGYAVHARGTEAARCCGRCCAWRENVVHSSKTDAQTAVERYLALGVSCLLLIVCCRSRR